MAEPKPILKPLLIRLGRALGKGLEYLLSGCFVVAGVWLAMPIGSWVIAGEFGSYDKVWPVLLRCAAVAAVTFVVAVSLSAALDHAEGK